MNQEFQEKAEYYLQGKMSHQEASEFEQMLAKNQDLKDEFLIISDIDKHFFGDTSINHIPQNEYTEKLRAVIRSEEAVKAKTEIAKAGNFYKKESNRKKNYLGIAASLAFIILFCVGIYFFKEPQNENLYASFYDTMDLPSIITRGSDEALVNKAIVAFQNKDYQESLDLLKSSETTKNNKQIAILLHYGMIYLEIGNINMAVDKFNEVIDSDSIDKTKGYWFKALAYIKAEDYEKARLILQEISANPDYFNHSKAKQLLQKIP